MKVDSVRQNYFTPKTTGYAATTALGMSVVSAKVKPLRKTHKPFAYASLILTALHIGLIEHNHHKYKKNVTKLS